MQVLRDFTVVRHGVDSSGRTIFMTKFMQAWWEDYCVGLGFAPTIVQGGFMTRNGGGADASEGYHDEAGCLDLRVWDKTPEQVAKMVREGRRRGAATYLRDAKHGGMDSHIHLCLGCDAPLADGAAWQWQEYLAGRDGLASRGRDYHWRPDPLVTEWSPTPKPTPNITTALKTRDAGIRRNALVRIIDHGKPAARKAAKSYLAALTTIEKAKGKARAARAALKKEEVR